MVTQPQIQTPQQQPPPPPLHLPSVQPVASQSTHMASYACAVATQALHMILSSTSRQELEGSSSMSSARVQSIQSTHSRQRHPLHVVLPHQTCRGERRVS